MLDRLASAHAAWRKIRPPAISRPRSPDEIWAEIQRKRQFPEPLDAEMIREAPTDPLVTAICSQLSVVGWRLYAKGGRELLTQVYSGRERDDHPGFVSVMRRAWNGIGFPDDPRGVWETISLL